MTYNPWAYQKAIEKRIAAALMKASNQMAKAVQGATSVQEIIQILAGVSQQPWWKQYANAVALKMTKSLMIQSAKTWKDAARRGQRGPEIFKNLQRELTNSARFHELLLRNSTYIQSLPTNMAKQATSEAATCVVEGLRSSEMVGWIKEKMPNIGDNKARLIARTETAKTQAAITQIRAEDLGIDWYVWRTAGDARVRNSHDIMAMVLCRYSDPPSPELLDGEHIQKGQSTYYGPGEVYNCRCYAEPVVYAHLLKWPMKVYYNGQIQRMTQKQFLAIAG